MKAHTTAGQFAAELEAAGCKVDWDEPTVFRVRSGRGDQARYATVYFYRDADSFYYAAVSHRSLRSMSAVRRYLKV